MIHSFPLISNFHSKDSVEDLTPRVVNEFYSFDQHYWVHRFEFAQCFTINQSLFFLIFELSQIWLVGIPASSVFECFQCCFEMRDPRLTCSRLTIAYFSKKSQFLLVGIRCGHHYWSVILSQAISEGRPRKHMLKITNSY